MMTNNIKKLGLLATAIIFMAFASPALAIEGSTSATPKVNLTFPIAELGNCDSLAACKSYCNDSANSTACIAFAKKKGFYHEPKTSVQADIVNAAKTELGCDSADACKALCQIADNYQKCADFAQKHGLVKNQNSPSKLIMSKAKAYLGCDSAESCIVVCAKPENYEKCANFAKLVGLQRPNEGSGSAGGCKSGDCQRPGPPPKPASGAGDLKNLNTQAFGQYCRENPGKCSANTTELKKQFEYFCQTNPEKCRNATPSAFSASASGKTGPNPPFNPPAGVQGISTANTIVGHILELWSRLFH